jgi:hypothetical protein
VSDPLETTNRAGIAMELLTSSGGVVSLKHLANETCHQVPT